MENSLHYIELSKDPIRFDSVSQLNNVFFDDANKQIFAVRSGGATGVVVKGPMEDNTISFCMDDRGIIRSIKFSPDNLILAVQRKENSVEFICFQDSQPVLNDIIVYTAKSSLIYGFVWVHLREVALISKNSVEIFSINTEKKQIKSIKSIALNVKWFAWCPEGNLALLSVNDGSALYPVILKQKTITKLPRLELDNQREVPERDVTLGQIYGTLAVLILQQTPIRLVEVVIYLLNGPGLAPRKVHVLRLGHSGRFAMNIVDNLVVVHHQASATSLLFDIALSGEVDTNGITYHAPVTPGRTIKPFSLKLPSISLDGQTMDIELYSTNWVLFQPNIVIDAKLGCMWYLSLQIQALCSLITDRVTLVEFLLQRTNGKAVLLEVLRQLVGDQYNGTLLPIIENVFNKINAVYQNWVQIELQTQTAQPTSVKSVPKLPIPPKVLVDQNDMVVNVFSPFIERPYIEKVLILYIQSLSQHNISAQEDLSKMVALEMIRSKHYHILQKLVEYSLILESKAMACYLLSHSKLNPSITQTALDMLSKLNAYEIIMEVLLGQGKVIDALRIARNLPECDSISARKYLEAAQKAKDPLVFYAVYMYFQQRNMRLRGNFEFLKTEQCGEFVQHFTNLFGQNKIT